MIMAGRISTPNEQPHLPMVRQARYNLGGAQIPVSYSHLRAHETEAHLVCRLLLEKEALEQNHSHEMETDRSDGAHECDGERDAEVECAQVAIPVCARRISSIIIAVISG